jgi:hypothetical protein
VETDGAGAMAAARGGGGRFGNGGRWVRVLLRSRRTGSGVGERKGCRLEAVGGNLVRPCSAEGGQFFKMINYRQVLGESPCCHPFPV